MLPVAIATVVTPVAMFILFLAFLVWTIASLCRRPGPATNPSRREARKLLASGSAGAAIGLLWGLIPHLARVYALNPLAIESALLGVLIIGLLITLLTRLYWLGRHAGRVMLRVPVSGRDRRWLIVALLFFAFLAASELMLFSGGGVPRAFVVASLAVLLLLFAVLAYGYAIGSQVRERGIVWAGSAWYLIAWEKLRGFAWEGKDGTALRLDVRNRFPFLGSVTVYVPADSKLALDDVLREHGVPPAA